MIKYNPNDADSIVGYAKGLLKKSLRDLVDADIISKVGDGKKSKGKFGNLIEKYYFHYEPNSISLPDFPDAGLELKTTPLKKLKKGKIVAKERLSLSMINFMSIINESRENNSFIKKNGCLLLIFYLHNYDLSLWDYVIEIVEKRTIPKDDLEIIKQDWNKIKSKVGGGLAHELSEGDTFYLSACTKSKNNKDRTPQPNSETKAKPRAYAFKQSYVNKIIDQLGFKQPDNYETILKDTSVLKKVKFETFVENKFAPFIGLTPEEISNKIGYKFPKKLPKHYLYILARKILGVESANIEEFDKADVTMKVMRIRRNGTPREDISFPAFKYTEIVNEKREESTILSTMDKKFFFVIFQESIGGDITLKKTMFRNIPYNDLHTDVKFVFEETKKRIKEYNTKNLPKASDTRVAHVRYHAQNKEDTYETLDGEQDTKQSFWFNRLYIAEQIK